MNNASTSTSAQWFARMREAMSKAWRSHVRQCELVADMHRRFWL